MRALILEQGHVRGALAAARALAQDGWTVGSGAPVNRSLSGSSRAVARRHRVPAAGEGAPAFVTATATAIAEQGYEVLFSCDDAGVLALSRHRDELGAIFPYAEHATVLRAFDKLELTREAQQAGLAVPRTEPAEAARLEDFQGIPLVVKPRLTFVEGGAGRVEASPAPDVPAALARAAQMRALGAEPIVQERVRGRLMAFTAVTDSDARVVAQVQQMADLIWPPGAGVSARAHTVEVDERLARKVARLLEALGWFGIAELQFLLGDDRVPRLVDLNGRFYGSLELAVRSGPNLPAIWARLATGRPLGGVPRARPGVRYQWLAGDVRAAYLTAPRRRVAAALGSSIHALGSAHAVWRATDPWPALFSIGEKLARWMRTG